MTNHATNEWANQRYQANYSNNCARAGLGQQYQGHQQAAYRIPPRMWLEDLGYDKRAQRVCFHGECPFLAPCVRLDICCGRPPIVREQSALWAEHQKQGAEADAPYAFWLGADA